MTWLQQIPIERVLLVVFVAGVTFQKIAQHTRSLRDQGRRLGDHGTRISRIEGALARAGLLQTDASTVGDGR